jgi:hypothetical protein
MADSIKISLELADKAAQQSLTDFVNKANNADRAFKKLGDAGNQSFGGLNVSIGKALSVFDIFTANLAANIATKALTELGELASKAFNVFIVDGVKAAQESETALNSLNVAMAQAGNYSDKASKDFQAFAAEIQRTTTVSDDAIIKNAALLQSMTRLDNEGLKRATKAAIELSSAFNIDLETATRTVAKATEGNVTSLQKLGLQFNKGGSDAVTFANALTAIESRSGTAASKLNTFEGAVQNAGGQFGEIQEAMGNIIVQNPVLVAAIGEVGRIFGQLAGYVTKNKTSLTELVAEGFIGLIEVSKYVVASFNVIYGAAVTVFNGFKIIVSDFLAAITIPLALFSDTYTELYKVFAESSAKADKDIGAAFDSKVFAEAGEALDRVGRSAETAFDKMVSGANASSSSLKNNSSAVVELTDLQIAFNQASDAFANSLANQSVAVDAAYKQQLEALQGFYDNKIKLEDEREGLSYEERTRRLDEYYTQADALAADQLAREELRIQQSTVSEEKKQAALKAVKDKYAQDDEKREQSRKQDEDKLRKQKEADFKSTLGTIATLQQSSNKELFFAGKAAAIAQIAIDAPQAIIKALASAPPPFNFALAGLVGAAVAVQAANIAGASPPAFEQGGIVPGISYSGDKVSARVNSGEMILNRQQQAELFKVANGSSGKSDSSDLPNQIAAAIAAEIRNVRIGLEVNGREIMNTIRSELNGGRTLT